MRAGECSRLRDSDSNEVSSPGEVLLCELCNCT